MTVNSNRTKQYILPTSKDEIIEEIKLNASPVPPKKSSQNGKKYFKFNKKSSTGSSIKTSSSSSSSSNNSTSNSADSFTTRMRKFVSTGNAGNANAPVSRRKQKKSESDLSNLSSTVSRSSSEPALNQPQEAFVKEAPSMISLYNRKPSKKKKSFFKKKKSNAVLPSGSTTNSSGTSSSTSSATSSAKSNHAPKEPVFHTDIRTNNTRLVTPRQRQEIYALNRVMTRLENEKFKKFCHEKGFKGDLEKEALDYDIFM